MPANYAFTANTPIQKILLFKIKEVKNSYDKNFLDLIFIFPGSDKYLFNLEIKNLFLNNNESHYKKAVNPHITVHYNPKDENIVIKKTYKDRSQQEENIYQIQINSGVKKDKLFVPITFRNFGNTNTEKFKYNNNKKYKEICLNYLYNPNQDTLQIMIIVSLIEKCYFNDVEFPANTISHDFKNFKVTLIYKLFNMPSLEQSINFTPICNSGLDWWEINNLVTDGTLCYNNYYFKSLDGHK